MKQSQKLFLYSLSSLAIMASSVAYADEDVVVPTLEGGLNASVGAIWLTPSSDFQQYFPNGSRFSESSHLQAQNVTPDYTLGIDASIGYVFEETANGIELSYRNLNTSDTDSFFTTDQMGFLDFNTAAGNLGYELNAGDLLISQFINIGDHMQMRLLGGLSYVELEYDLKSTGSLVKFGVEESAEVGELSSEFTGWGPRVGADTRYDFGQGFGIVGGASLAYYLGELDTRFSVTEFEDEELEDVPFSAKDSLDDHSVVNLRGNLGVDYVYFFDNDEGTTLGLELGYMVDFYDDAIGIWINPNEEAETSSVTFSGPYLNVKGVW